MYLLFISSLLFACACCGTAQRLNIVLQLTLACLGDLKFEVAKRSHMLQKCHSECKCEMYTIET